MTSREATRGFSRQQLEGFRNKVVPDLVGANPKLLFVGINPGLWTAATQTHFAHPSNRFYPALTAAGIIDITVDRSTGLSPSDRTHLIDRGIAITNIVARATAKASELDTKELREGADRLIHRVEELQPVVVAIAGITAFRTAFDQPKASVGLQTNDFGSSDLWVVPNPSGLNAHETVDSLAKAYAGPAAAAGIVDLRGYG